MDKNEFRILFVLHSCVKWTPQCSAGNNKENSKIM